MGKLTLYGLDASPPVRTVLLTLKALDLPYEYVQVNLLAKEQLSPEYLEKNPQHTVPTLQDDDDYLWDSHAISAYLVNKYGKTDDLYPSEPLKRAVVDQRLHFESGVLFAGALMPITKPLLFFNVTEVPQQKIDALIQVYEFLEKFLDNHDYIAGDNLTIADFSLISTISSTVSIYEIDEEKYPKLTAWIARIQELPYYEEANAKGAAQFGQLMKSKQFTIVP